jgi:pantothenate synthetase
MLEAAHDSWNTGERRAAKIEERMRQELRNYPGVALQYIAIVEPRSLAPVEQVEAATVVAVAARVGATRLLDNIILGEGLR